MNQPGVTVTELDTWRTYLAEADHQASQDLDKAIMTLSSGAFGLSLVFVHDIAPTPVDTGWMVGAWVAFVLSLLAVMVSFLASQAAIRHDIAQIDAGATPRTKASGWSKATRFLTIGGVALLVTGVALLLVFGSKNI